MDDNMRRIGPEDLLLPKHGNGTGAEPSQIWSAAANPARHAVALAARGVAQPVDTAAADEPGEVVPETPVEQRCPGCDGAGYYTERVPYGHPHFGVLFPCHCKVEAEERRRREEFVRLSNLVHFQDKTFETFDAYNVSLLLALTRAQEFAQRLRGWLVLFGAYGCGKTHLAAAIANAAVARDTATYFGAVPDILDHLRSTFGPDSQIDYDELFSRVREVPLLVLDDLGTEAATLWAREKLFQIVNHRYNLELPTVITTNRTPDDIDPRIRSRMWDRRLTAGGPLTVEAPDYRNLSDEQRRTHHRRATILRARQHQAGRAGGGSAVS